MFICCTGTGLLVQEQKMAETVLADLIIYPWNLFVCRHSCSQLGKNSTYQFAAHFTHLGPFFQRCRARQYLTHGFSELDQKTTQMHANL